MSEDVKAHTDELPEGLSAALDKLMANPQLINMVASALGGAAAPPSDTEKKESAENTVPAMSLDKILPLVGKLSGGGASCKHEPLLCAIKPYLSPARCQAIDTIIRISKMSDVIGQLKL